MGLNILNFVGHSEWPLGGQGTGHLSPWQIEAYSLVCGQIIYHS